MPGGEDSAQTESQALSNILLRISVAIIGRRGLKEWTMLAKLGKSMMFMIAAEQCSEGSLCTCPTDSMTNSSGSV